MPTEWHTTPEGQRELHLWPHRSLTQRGFVAFIAVTALLIALPALSVLGSPVAWALLPFLIATIGGIWFALRRNARDREVIEVLRLAPDTARLSRIGPHGQRRDWQANPYWLRPVLHPTEGPVPQYLTLSGGPRAVELGAFLSPEERVALAEALTRELDRLRQHRAD